jgi:hypothetical protein
VTEMQRLTAQQRYALLVLEVWCRQYLDRNAVDVPASALAASAISSTASNPLRKVGVH